VIPGDLLKSLVLDAWYKVLVQFGGIVLALALFVPAQGMSNRQVQAIAGGFFFLGLGIWMDQRRSSTVDGANALIQHIVVTNFEYWAPGRGLILDALGIVLIALGVFAVIY
jgi:hypothetical protein